MVSESQIVVQLIPNLLVAKDKNKKASGAIP
jgi:hypothetical protein